MLELPHRPSHFARDRPFRLGKQIRISARDRNSRRSFCSNAVSLVLWHSLPLAAQIPAVSPSPTRPDVATIDRDRILAAAERFLTQKPTPLTSLPCPRSPGTAHDFYSEASVVSDSAAVFTAHRDAVFNLGLAVPALAAAYALTGEERFAAHGTSHLRAWFVDPATSMTPALNFGQVLSAGKAGRFQGILETLPLVEVAQAIPFLAASQAVTDKDLEAIRAWFAAYLLWLTAPTDEGPRLGALARDQKDHHATSWLLQASAYARAAEAGGTFKSENKMAADLRHRFKTVTLRAQITADGAFPHELTSATPYRDSLFNLDMLAAVCEILTTRFESLWDYQLEDGPGMRAAIAYHFPFMADRGMWPHRADAQHFTELPGRRVSLLLAARPFARPEYASLWKTLKPDPPDLDILRTMPVQQPLLWVRQPVRRVAQD